MSGAKRFAFYGRVSTEDQQDPESSMAWQLSRATTLIEPTDGQIVEQFFDVGQSRSLPWKRRPEAFRLLNQIENSNRDFDAVVIGEPQRAFYGNQFGLTFPVFVHYNVGLWVPEVGGAIDPGSDAHDLVMSLYGGMSKGERNRIKTRVRASMASQAAQEGRFLGGRPPYGYRLGDAGPHPNPSKAANGQRLRILEIDPISSVVVQRIFAEYIAGRGIYAIAEGLTADAIPSPSAYDSARNRHRANSNGAWSKSAIRSILKNPRYTGYQVWNRQRRDEELIDVHDVALGHQSRMRWNTKGDWIWSEQPTHDAIISQADFAAVDAIFTSNKRTKVRRERTKHTYLLSGSVYCAICNRRMQGSWNHGRAYYRCKFPTEYAIAEHKHPKVVYVQEAHLTKPVDQWIYTLFSPAHIEHTTNSLINYLQDPEPDQHHHAHAKRKIKECDNKLNKYRAAIEAGTDPTIVGEWIAEVQTQRRAAEQTLRQHRNTNPYDEDQVKAIIRSLQNTTSLLETANPADKKDVYRELNLTITYSKDRTVFEANPVPCTNECVGGGT